MKEIIEMIKYLIDRGIVGYGLGVSMFALVFFVNFILRYVGDLYGFAEKIQSRKLNDLKYMLIDSLANPLRKICIENEISRIKNKKICGCDDVALQQYILILSSKYDDLVSVSFFIKLRSVFDFKKIKPRINVNKALVIGWWIERAFFFQFVLLAVFYIVMAITLSDILPLKNQVVLYLMSSILIILYPLMVKNTPTLREVRLMKEIQKREALNYA